MASSTGASGIDYGIRPPVVLLGDVDFPQRLADAGFVGVGYMRIPHFGLLVDPPALAFIFEDADAGSSCFEHFHEWIERGGGDDALGIEFVEFREGGYCLLISQEPGRLISRLVPPSLQGEVAPVLYAGMFQKTFSDRSDGFSWFVREAATRPFVVVPCGVDGVPDPSVALIKRHLVLREEGSSADMPLQRGEGVVHAVPPPPPHEVAALRRMRLNAFFPITRYRLPWSEEYAVSLADLCREGLRPWQVEQAACNLACRHSRADLFQGKGDGGGVVDVLQALVEEGETATRPVLPLDRYTTASLRAQAIADARYLVSAMRPEGEGHRDGEAVSLGELLEAMSALGVLDG